MTRKSARLALLVLAAGTLAMAATAAPQDQKPAGKYAAYCGDYRFDLSVLGLGEITAKVFAENETLFVLSSTSSNPDAMSPIEGEPAKFFIDDPDEGRWDFEFLKDESGRFNKLRIINGTLGVDAVGDRIGG